MSGSSCISAYMSFYCTYPISFCTVSFMFRLDPEMEESSSNIPDPEIIPDNTIENVPRSEKYLVVNLSSSILKRL